MTMHDNESPDAFRDERFLEAKKLMDASADVMANFMASLGDGVSVQDRNMRIVYQNRSQIENFGSHIGEHCYNVYEKRSMRCDGCPMVGTFATGQKVKMLRVGITKEGVPIRFEIITSALRNDAGEIVAGIELCRMVEDRERAFDELREALEKLKDTQEELVRSKRLAGIGQLAAGVAHEINNPTMAIMGNLCSVKEYIYEFIRYIDMMEQNVGDNALKNQEVARIKESLQKIIETEDYRYLKSDLPQAIDESLNGLKKIKGIVSALLEFATTVKGGRRTVDVNAEIRSTLVLLDNELRRKGRVVTVFGELPELLADPQQLKQMFANLILNASQAIDANGVITIKTEVKNKHICIGISDNGVGMPKEVIENIFNPFFTTREVGSGVGLGLSIAYRIVENHNGTIDVQSEAGHGTTFTIKLPIASAAVSGNA